MLRALARGDDLFEMFDERHKKAGNTYISIGLFGTGVHPITTCEPRNMQAILGTQFEDYYMGQKRRAQFEPVLGKSIFNSDGPSWAHARALFRPVFARSNINDLEETERAVNIFLSVLPRAAHGWTGPVDIQPLFYRFTLVSERLCSGETYAQQR
jgi:cytochrome P450